MMAEQKTIKLTGDQIIGALKQEKARMESIQRAIVSVDNLLQEIFFAKDSLKAVKNTKKGEKAMISLGAGIFLDIKIDENTKVKKSLAGNVLINSQIEKTINELEEREKEAQEKLEELNKQQQAIYANMNTLTQIVTTAEKARREQK
jgi:prefoldin alpha subunit